MFFGVSLVSGIIGTGVCRMINLADYNTMMDTLLEFIMGESTSGLVTIEEIFGSTYYLFVIYMAISMAPAVISAVIFFIYFALRNALSIHLRSNMVRAPSMACSQIFKITWRRKKELRMDYLRLQWPIILIITVLPILTSTLTFIFLRDYSIMSTFGVASILLGVGLYFPFYSANNEALWIKYENEFKQSVYLFAENSVHNIQRRMEMADQEKEELEKALNDLKEHINQQTSQNEEKTDEDNPSDDNNDQQV